MEWLMLAGPAVAAGTFVAIAAGTVVLWVWGDMRLVEVVPDLYGRMPWVRRREERAARDREAALQAFLEKQEAEYEDARNNRGGEWVPASDMNPHTDVGGRIYRTDDGHVRRLYDVSQLRHDRPAEWFFPTPH